MTRVAMNPVLLHSKISETFLIQELKSALNSNQTSARLYYISNK